jgi:hypothetical protein
LDNTVSPNLGLELNNNIVSANLEHLSMIVVEFWYGDNPNNIIANMGSHPTVEYWYLHNRDIPVLDNDLNQVQSVLYLNNVFSPN